MEVCYHQRFPFFIVVVHSFFHRYQLSERCTELEEKSARKENYDPLPSKMSGNVSSLRKFYSVSATAIKGDDQFRDRDTERKRKYRSVPKQTAIVLKHPPQGISVIIIFHFIRIDS